MYQQNPPSIQKVKGCHIVCLVEDFVGVLVKVTLPLLLLQKERKWHKLSNCVLPIAMRILRETERERRRRRKGRRKIAIK